MMRVHGNPCMLLLSYTYTQNACTHEYVWHEEECREEYVRKRASRVVYFAGLLATRRWPALREIMQLSHCCYRATASL